ncbi:ABC transporter permease [Limosilactobacillus fastidiosus]|uniref:ABC transporter permease n=1 Tax=Limosilactobacillus fastidiosus TaxID=2759855 RepID=A0A7W3TYY7_9LACO|nr:ABC transporter permease [Limosilactobacillus fastidiosus]MBB1063451.1 ABC transporter permease [Limosilactobacillus fastidiosus]MBB1085857.1 ABC transporter permease [Limosilactobacillus fastidiosus]MCD7084719.1 ABC transporter permease [Limosilactobacillus fastidiosus]MCD7085806.1 ABC transporter permease [Limosilactobacillus fastidiosus]MCD7113883.1 ABC transporter permease [Limosilactobacillus fastidiosus]
MKQKLAWSKIYLGLVLIILYVPILYLMIFSFSSGKTMERYHGFSFQHYLDLFADSRMITIVINTVLVAVLASLVATIIGTLGALAIKETHSPWKNSLLSLNNVLMVSPDVIIGASFLIFFTVLGIRLGFVSVLLSHIAFSIPIVVLMVLPKINELSPTLVDAAYDLGATRWQALSRVVLPAILPGIVAGYFMALTYSLDDFAVTFFVTGNGFSTLSVEIYSRARQGVSLEINALSTLMFLVSLILVIGYYFVSKHAGRRQRIVAIKEGDAQ